MKLLLKHFPEFVRIMWNDISLIKLILMQLVVGCFFYSIYYLASNPLKKVEGLYDASLYTFLFITIILGSKNAYDSIYREFKDKTWDNQRLTGLGPFRLMIGKVFGSTFFVWTGGFTCLLVFFATCYFSAHGWEKFKLGICLIIGAFFVHCFALSMSIVAVKKSRFVTNIYNGVYLVPSIGSLFILGGITTYLAGLEIHYVRWLNFEFSVMTIWIFTLVYFSVWVFISTYIFFRTEFTYPTNYIIWVPFFAITGIYFSGFLTHLEYINPASSILITLSIFLLEAVFLTYVSLFIHPNLKESLDLISKKYLRNKIKNIISRPDWTFFLSISVVLAVLTLYSVFQSPDNFTWHWKRKISMLLPISILLFLIRDTLVFLVLAINTKIKKINLTMNVYFMVAYVILPWISKDYEYFFFPYIKTTSKYFGDGIIFTLLPITAQALVLGLVFVFMMRKKRKTYSNLT